MSGIANDADVGRNPLAGEGDSFEIVAAGQSEAAGRGFCCAPAGEEIALEPQADSTTRDRDTTGSWRVSRRSGERAAPPLDEQAACRATYAATL